MRIAAWKGKSGASKAIRLITRSEYSHVGFVFDEATNQAIRSLYRDGQRLPKLEHILPGAVVEAWDNYGVRNVASISDQHNAGTTVDVFGFVSPLTHSEERALVQSLHEVIGEPYDWTNVFRFVTRKAPKANASWFCSELVAAKLAEAGRPLFNRTNPALVPPDWIQRSIAMEWLETQITL